MNKHFILATAGHVDHGKSSLVKALTGTDPDRLPEEQARGITIDLGFAFLDLAAGSDAGFQYRLGIVDVPGHEDFIKNMVAGVGSVDVALLVVAADDGWMPQTEEHLQILIYLGVTRLVVALTKIDLPGVHEARLNDSIRQQLGNTPFASAPIVPVSTVGQLGIDQLKSALVSVLSDTPSPRDIGKPRLAVDRAFTLRGIGTVVTGTLTGGPLRVGQAVVLQPAGTLTRIRSIQSHNQDLPSVGPGTRAALNLADVAVGEHVAGTSHPVVRRGDVVTLAEFGPPVSFLDVRLTRSARLRQNQTPTAHPLKDGLRVRVHFGSGNWPARLRLYDAKEIAAGESALVRLCFETPVFAFVGDRFIVRDWSEQITPAGGVVLAEDSSPKGFRDPVRRAFLEKCAANLDGPNLRVAAQLKWTGLGRRPDFLAKSDLSAAEIETILGLLSQERQARIFGDLIADALWWESLCVEAVRVVDAAHQSYPDRVGLPISKLRSALQERLPLPGAFEALLAHLLKNGFAQAGTVIKRAAHRPELPPHLQATGAKLREQLTLKPFEPPSRSELAPDASRQQALRFLIGTGEVVELDAGTVMTQQAFAYATDTIKKFLLAHRSATVSELRQAVGATRRIMVPLLERLDHNGVTLRQGDRRVLRQLSQ